MDAITTIEMKVPDWVQEVLSGFENGAVSHNEVEISDALRRVGDTHKDMTREESKGYHAEWAAFMFIERPDGDSVWGTYFAPMGSWTQEDGTDFYSPDVKNLDAEVLAYWENRAKSVHDPVMRARYADLVWDLESVITKGRRQYEYAVIAIDAYLEAIEKQLCPMDIEGVGWLRRALDLSLSISDKERQKRVVDSMLTFYEKVVDPHHIGVWIFPFDFLYDKQGLLSAEQETRVIADLEAMLLKTTSEGKDFDPFGAQAAAERLAQHYERRCDKPSVQRVIKAYGQAFARISRDASPMLAMAWLQPVVERYEQEGMKQEAEQLQIMSAAKGRNISEDLKQVSVKAEINQEDVDKLVEHLIGSGNLKTSLRRVADYFIPKADDARQLLESMRANTPLLSIIPVVVVDNDGRPSAKIGSIDEDLEGRLHQQLGQTISFYQPFLTHALEKLREQYAPTVEDILNVLYESPLFIENRRDLIREGLVAYERRDYVKAIHVLVPQVEQTLRNLLVLLRIPPEKTVKRHPGIMDVKSMNDVLGDERVQQVLTENLWRYLAVLYIDRRGGLNLRNDLAHGLVGANAFNRYIADRVFHSLLALTLLRAQQDKQKRE